MQPAAPPRADKPGQVSDTAKNAWNGWLDERDQAPGEVLAGWLRDKTLGSLEVARDYAQAGLTLAKSRADVARAGRSLLESGGEPARQDLLMKQKIGQATAADGGVVQALRYYSKHYREEAAFQTDLDLGTAFSRRGALYAKALEVLGEPPQAVGMTPIESDAVYILRLEQAASGIGRPFSADGGGALASLLSGTLAGGSSSSSAVPAAGDVKFEKLLKELFRLHDLNGDGEIGEVELIKLNQKIALLHYGAGADKAAVREKFSGIFRRNLDAEGRPVAYPAFREHALKMLADLDPTRPAQEMILEQFICEAELAREAFHDAAFASITDAEFLPHLAADRPKEAALSPVVESPPAACNSSQSVGSSRFAGATKDAKSPTGWAFGGAAKEAQLPTDRAREGAPAPTSGGYPRFGRDDSPPRAGSRSVTASFGEMSLDGRGGATSASISILSDDAKAASGEPDRPSSERGSPAKSAEGGAELSAGKRQTHSEDQRSRQNEDSGGPAARHPVQVDDQKVREREVCGFATKDPVQVWSNSKQDWLDGVVLQAFPEDCESGGYSVPAGTLKVTSAAGTKWIRPGQAASMLRPKPAA